MSSKLIVAGAGSGKTTWLVNEALKIAGEKVLITTFTEANERGIREKFYELHGCIPANVTIMTWFAFLLQHGVRPYQSVVYDDKIKGMLLVNSKSGFRYKVRGKSIYYGEKDVEPFYLSPSKKIYSDKIAKAHSVLLFFMNCLNSFSEVKLFPKKELNVSRLFAFSSFGSRVL